MAEVNNTPELGVADTEVSAMEPTNRQEEGVPMPMLYLDRILALHGVDIEGASDDDDSTYVYGEDDGYTPSADGVREDHIASEADSEDDDNDDRSDEDGEGSEGGEVQVPVVSNARREVEAGAAPSLDDVSAEANANSAEPSDHQEDMPLPLVNRVDRVVSLLANSISDEAATSEDDSSYSYDNDYDYLCRDDGSSTSTSSDEDDDQKISRTADGMEFHGPTGVGGASLKGVPADVLGVALDYLALADVLSCRRTQNRHLCQDAIGKVRHLNVMKAGELDERWATVFTSVQSVNVLCLLTDFKLLSRSSSSSSSPKVKYDVNEQAVQRIPSFLKSFEELEHAFLGGYFNGSKCFYEARSCRDSDKRELISKVFETLCLAFFPGNSPQGPVVEGLESVEGSWCLSMPVRSRPWTTNSSALTRAQISWIVERLIQEGAIRKVFVTRPTHGMATRSMARREEKIEFIFRMRRMGSGNGGRRQVVLCLKNGVRAILQALVACDAAATRECADQAAIAESLRLSMRNVASNHGDLPVDKVVIRDATLDFLVETVGFGLDREEFIPIDFQAEPAVPDYCLWDP